MFTFGWFSSGRDQAAIDLFDAVMDRMDTGFIPGRLAYVFCDRAPGETEASDRFQAAVKARGVPLVTHSSGELRALIKARAPELPAFRNAFDARVLERLEEYAADLAVLAGYMLIVSPRLCRAFLCLNLHPALPGGPKGTWQQVMWQVMKAGQKEAGHDASGHPGIGRSPAGDFFFACRSPGRNLSRSGPNLPKSAGGRGCPTSRPGRGRRNRCSPQSAGRNCAGSSP
jgi:folate-dependent phosphoribosylglycinamide formyltransferase PurN